MIVFTSSAEAAWESNLVEETGRRLDASGGLQFDLHAYEIKTFKVQFKRR
jgi:hypothetical protein